MPYFEENIVKEIKYANCYVGSDNYTHLEFFFDKDIKSAYFFGEKKTEIQEIGRFTLVTVTMQQNKSGVVIATANIEFKTGCLQHFDFKINRVKRYNGDYVSDQINDFSINLSPDWRPINTDVFDEDDKEDK